MAFCIFIAVRRIFADSMIGETAGRSTALIATWVSKVNWMSSWWRIRCLRLTHATIRDYDSDAAFHAAPLRILLHRRADLKAGDSDLRRYHHATFTVTSQTAYSMKLTMALGTRASLHGISRQRGFPAGHADWAGNSVPPFGDARSGDAGRGCRRPLARQRLPCVGARSLGLVSSPVCDGCSKAGLRGAGISLVVIDTVCVRPVGFFVAGFEPGCATDRVSDALGGGAPRQ